MTQYSDRTELELKKFSDALTALLEVADDEEDKKGRDSLLLRFVFTFEMAWQSMRLVLQELGDRETPRLAFAALETGFQLGLITDPGLWKDIREARNAVVHAYDEERAIQLAAYVRTVALPELMKLHEKLLAGR